MLPTLQIALLWAAFIWLHVYWREPARRARLRARFGPRTFGWAFGLAALALFVPMLRVIATHRHAGPVLYLLHDDLPWLRWVALGTIVCGFTFLLQPSWKAGTHAGIRGLHRITRDPWLTGWWLAGLGHLLVNGSLFDVVAFGGFLVYPVISLIAQERWHARDHAEAYREVRLRTSILPFAAILQGRQRLALGELPWARMIVLWLLLAAFYRHHQLVLYWFANLW